MGIRLLLCALSNSIRNSWFCLDIFVSLLLRDEVLISRFLITSHVYLFEQIFLNFLLSFPTRRTRLRVITGLFLALDFSIRMAKIVRFPCIKIRLRVFLAWLIFSVEL